MATIKRNMSKYNDRTWWKRLTTP